MLLLLLLWSVIYIFTNKNIYCCPVVNKIYITNRTLCFVLFVSGLSLRTTFILLSAKMCCGSESLLSVFYPNTHLVLSCVLSGFTECNWQCIREAVFIFGKSRLAVEEGIKKAIFFWNCWPCFVLKLTIHNLTLLYSF